MTALTLTSFAVSSKHLTVQYTFVNPSDLEHACGKVTWLSSARDILKVNISYIWLICTSCDRLLVYIPAFFVFHATQVHLIVPYRYLILLSDVVASMKWITLRFNNYTNTDSQYSTSVAIVCLLFAHKPEACAGCLDWLQVSTIQKYACMSLTISTTCDQKPL